MTARRFFVPCSVCGREPAAPVHLDTEPTATETLLTRWHVYKADKSSPEYAAVKLREALEKAHASLACRLVDLPKNHSAAAMVAEVEGRRKALALADAAGIRMEEVVKDAAGSLAGVKPGDTLVMVSWHSSDKARAETVEKVTPQQIVMPGGRRFWKRNGVELQEYRPDSVRLPERGELARLKAEAAAAHAKFEAEHAAEREAMRGRATGYLLAAYEAVNARLARVGEEDPLGKFIASRLFALGWDLESAERDLRAACVSLRSRADEAERMLALDRDDGRIGYSGADGFRDAVVNRAVLHKQVQPLIDLAARYLRVDYADVIRPMMAKPASDGAEVEP